MAPAERRRLNRWQRGEIVAALYLADTPETAWAEWYRHLAERAVPPMQTLPRALWRWAVELERVADLRTRGRAPRRFGLVGSAARPRRLAGRSSAPARRCNAAGWPALVAPSAARPDGFGAVRVRSALYGPPGSSRARRRSAWMSRRHRRAACRT